MNVLLKNKTRLAEVVKYHIVKVSLFLSKAWLKYSHKPPKDLTQTATSPRQGPPAKAPPGSDIWWPRLGTCSNLFTWRPPAPLVLTSGNYWIIYRRQTRAVSILLECFLVIADIYVYKCSILPGFVSPQEQEKYFMGYLDVYVDNYETEPSLQGEEVQIDYCLMKEPGKPDQPVCTTQHETLNKDLSKNKNAFQ